MALFTITGISASDFAKVAKKEFKLPKNITEPVKFETDIQTIYNAFAYENARQAVITYKDRDDNKKDRDTLRRLEQYRDKVKTYADSHGGMNTSFTLGFPMLIAWTSLNCRKYGKTRITFEGATDLAIGFRLYADKSIRLNSLYGKTPSKDELKKAIVEFVTHCVGDTTPYGKQFNIRMTDEQLEKLVAWYNGKVLKWRKEGIVEQDKKENDIIEQIVLSVLRKTFGFDDNKKVGGTVKNVRVL